MKFSFVPASDRRRSIYLTGICLSGVGLALVLSILVTLATHFGDPVALRARRSSIAFRAVAGILVALGGFGAMAVASPAHEMHEPLFHTEHDGQPLRSVQDRELLRREGEKDARIFDDPRHWPNLKLPRRLGRAPFAPAEQPTLAMHGQAFHTDDVPAMENVVVKIRCRVCRKLSAEEANYCEHCGHNL